MRGHQCDRHVQAWVEDRVRVLGLLEQLSKIRERLERSEKPHVQVWLGTQYRADERGQLVAVKTYEVRSL